MKNLPTLYQHSRQSMYYVRQGKKKKSSANQKVSLEAWSQNGNFPLNAYK